ncbi:MAG: hypothetical protein KDA61_06255, partial [Planctomycetales bacterium]|nr:hypothetical protein [Planctomycetales bacterium]
DVREAAAEVELATGAVIHAFTSGAMVQVFLLVACDAEIREETDAANNEDDDTSNSPPAPTS